MSNELKIHTTRKGCCGILELVVKDPWNDWSFGIGKSIFVVHANDVYHKLVEDRAWLANKVLETWCITQHVK